MGNFELINANNSTSKNFQNAGVLFFNELMDNDSTLGIISNHPTKVVN